MGKPKSVGRSPLISYHESPPSSERSTSQCFCMYSRSGCKECMVMQWTQCPTSASGSGSSHSECSPLLIGCQVAPSSSERNAPAAEIAVNSRFGLLGSVRITCAHSPPAPGCHRWPLALRRPGISCHVCPQSVERKIAASSTPAYTASASVGEGSRYHTRANSQGCCVPSYHWCVPGVPS